MNPARIIYGAALAMLTQTAAPAADTSCVTCHRDIAWVQESAWVTMTEEFLRVDVHNAVGLSCHDCHGGNPDPKLADDPLAAMDADYAANPYRGELERTAIPELCGRCHADPEYMKKFRPDARTDQLKEYWTSQHGILLKSGDTNVATCVDCHTTHTIRRPTDSDSKVYPTVVAETCRSCHSDPKRMGGYKLKTGQPIPIDQYERWRQSVHATALLEKEDLSAPTCNDCHGNHGATPPDLAAITFVCGQCHGREASLFRKSPKEEGFAAHNETYLNELGPAGCAECHEPPHPSASITNITSFNECTTCHGNHAVVSPRVTMLGPLPDTPCAYCHEETRPGSSGPLEPKAIRRHYERVKEDLLRQAAARQLEGDARFDWLIDQARTLSAHRTSGGRDMGEAAAQHEFERLFDKFRLGKTHFTYPDPVTGEPVTQKLVRCTDCHEKDSEGLATAARMSREMQDLAAETARAQRTLLAAQRGGVEVRKAHLQLDKAGDAQIELQVLVHSFSAATNSAFIEKQKAGLEVARAALGTGLDGLAELRFRHRGLLVSLAIILCVLIGLGLKIRQLSRRETGPQ